MRNVRARGELADDTEERGTGLLRRKLRLCPACIRCIPCKQTQGCRRQLIRPSQQDEYVLQQKDRCRTLLGNHSIHSAHWPGEQSPCGVASTHSQTMPGALICSCFIRVDSE